MLTSIEDCSIIRGLGLQRVRTGYYRVEGPVTAGLIVHPKACAVTWWWHGMRNSRKIQREKSHAGRFWFLCPSCHRRVLNLYIQPQQEAMGCRHCMGIIYPSQKVSWHKREPKRLRAWLRKFNKDVVQKYEKTRIKRPGTGVHPGS